MDQIAQEDELAGTLSPGDVAVLVRLKAQIPVIRRALEQEGIPCAAPAQEDCWQDPLCAAVLRLAITRGKGEAWKQLCRAWQDCGQWEALVQQLGLQHEAELIRARSEQVQILTLHASKGLEFKHVFLIGCSEGLIPYGSPPEGDLLEEERRLMYVAVTRAEDTLDVSYARAREDDGSDRGRRKSRFFR